MSRLSKTIPLIIDLRKNNKEYTLEKIGVLVGVTKQMVSKTLRASNLPTRGTVRKPRKLTVLFRICKRCGRFFDNRLTRKELCLKCKILKFRYNYKCKMCGREFIAKKRFMEYRIKTLKLKNCYCSHKCYLFERKDRKEFYG
ncbi:MAG: hypothetical protein AABY07_05970 [Nanoarchaeota archaeon]